MRESIHLVRAADEQEWNRWLEPADHDFYHTAAYHRFAEQSGEGEGLLAACGTAERYLAWPYLLRRLPERPLCDVTSVYGYPGPLAFGCSRSDPFLDRAWREMADLWRSQNVVSVFTRFHPLLENHRWASGAVEAGESVSIDLTASERDNWHDYQPGLRNRIHHGRRLGLRTEIDESWSRLDDFVSFYHATMARNHALPCYFFPLDYFRNLKRALGARACLMLTRLGCDIAAAGIFVEHRGIIQNHFCINNEAHRRLAPSKVLLDDVRLWARSRSARVFHLGGGRSGARDSLYVFKAAFSRRRHPFYTGRWILDPDAYQSLCRGVPSGDFFPAYRAPRASTETLQTI